MFVKITRRAGYLAVIVTFLHSGAAYGLSDNAPHENKDERSVPGQATATGSDVILERGMDTDTETEGTAHPETANTSKVPSTKEYVKEFPNDLMGGTKRIFNHDNVPIALIGFGLTALAFKADGEVKEECQEDQPLRRVHNIGNTLGEGYIHVGVGGGLFAAGQLFEDKKLADTGAVTLEALLINGIATESLKYSVGRQRPNGQGDKMSFPSGHTSSTATLAASISEMYDWDLKVAIPLYLTTALVGASRMDCNMHYLSDVLAGITLGTIVGRSVARYHKEKGEEQKLSFTPLYDKDCKGLVFSLKF
jgi:hypothetical protein